MSHNDKVIWLHEKAPVKPTIGTPCNGCGVCCAMEPCPVALVLLFQRRGSCRALEWEATARRYRCGMVERPQHYLRFVPAFAQALLQRLVYRWIAAGTACDASDEIVHVQTDRHDSTEYP